MGDGPGSVGGAVATLRSHWSAVEADFQRFYSVNLAEACWGSRSDARLIVGYLFNLPAEAATWRALGHGWTVGDHLSATTVDALHELIRLTVAVNSSDPQKTLKKLDPVRIPRPGDKPGQKRGAKVVSSTADVLALFGGG